MINNLLKQAVCVTFSACLIAACSSSNNSSGYRPPSSSSSSSSSSSGVTSPTSIVIAGDAIKGLISGGAVTVYPVVNGALDLTTILGTDTTDASGAYSISVDDYDGSPVAVRVTAADDGSTMMKCDLAGGCGEDKPFGSSISITDTSFNLDAIVPSVSSDAVSVNLSVLTDTASELALSALTAGNTAEQASSIIANSNSSVANRFGIIGNLTELPVIDITDPATVAASNSDVLEYNLYNAAIVEAVLNGDQQATIASAVSSFAQQYAGGGLADTEDSESATVTLTEILQTSSTVITAITEVESEIVLDLSGLQTQLTANAAQASNGSTEPDDGSLDEEQGEVSELLAVKRMVNDIRNLGNGINLTATESFSTQLDMAGDTFDAESGAVIEAMAMAAGSMSYAWEARMDDEAITSYVHEENGITVAISVDGDVVTYTVDTTLVIEGDETDTSVVVDLVGVDNNSTIEIVEEEVEAASGLRTITTDLDFDVDMSISGTSTSDAVEMEIVEGTFSGTLTADIYEERDDSGTSENGGDSDTETFDLADVVFDLEVALSEIGVDDPISFDGNLVLTLSALSLDSEWTDTNTYDSNGNWNGMETWDESLTAGAISFTLSGGFSSASGDSVNASIAILADATDFEAGCTGSEGYANQQGEWTWEETCAEEASSAYVDVSFTMVFSLDVEGVSEDVSASITGTRTALEDGTVDVELSYDGIMFDIEFDTASQTDTTSSFTITNQAGVVATLTETEAEGSSTMSGSIVLNGTSYATISEENGFVEVAYIDGSNVSM